MGTALRPVVVVALAFLGSVGGVQPANAVNGYPVTGTGTLGEDGPYGTDDPELEAVRA